MSRAGLLATLRIARRNAWRSRGRSLLIIAMVAAPVLGLSGIDVLANAAHLSPAEQATRQLGHAELSLQAVSSAPIRQNSEGGYQNGTVLGAPLASLARIRRLLPPGAVIRTDQRTSLAVRTPAGAAFASARELDYAAPLATGIVAQQGGRAPRTTGEVDLSPALLTQARLRIGAVVHTLHPTLALRVVGTAVEPGDLRGLEVFALPGTIPLAKTAAGVSEASQRDLLVGLPARVSATGLIPALNARGVLAVTRQQLLHPPVSAGGSFATGQVVGTISVVVGLAALEVILLAGAAFAVGARRSQRQLAVLAAGGGDSRQLRGVVLWGGTVLGAVGAVTGVVLGVALALAGRPLFEHIAGSMFGPLGLHPLQLLAIAVLGVLTGLLAAALPARTAARADVVAALAGRRGVTATRKRVPAIGVVLVAAGVLLAVLGARRGSRAVGIAAYGGGAVPSPSHSFDLILLGAALTEIGFVVCASALVGAAGRLARFLPLAPRLALRDASRHRARTGPAVAAIMAALAGSVALSVYLASNQAEQKASYTPQLRIGQAELNFTSPGRSFDPAVLRAVAAALPTKATVTLSTLTGPAASCQHQPYCSPARLQVPPVDRCPLQRPPLAGAPTDPRCQGQPFQPTVAVGGAGLLRAMSGHAGAAAVRALAAGKAVVFDRFLQADGRIDIEMSGPAATAAGSGPGVPVAAPPPGPPVQLSAVLVPTRPTSYPAALISPATARRLGGRAVVQSVIFDTRRPPDSQQIQAAQGALAARGMAYSLYVEQGYQGSLGLVLLALIGGSAVVTLGATAVATGLAAAEGRPDLGTLAAIGAAPRVRRLLAMSQAGTVAFLGAVLGVLAGLVPSIAILQARGSTALAVPWPALVASLLGVPMLAALAAGGLTRSRLPIIRRFG